MATIVSQEPNAAWNGVRLTNLNRHTFALLNEMDKVPGAQRALICDPRGTVLAARVSGEFARETYEHVGACVATILTACPEHPFREIELRFADRLVYVRTLGHAFVAVACAVNTNLSLLRMTLNVAAAPIEADKELQTILSFTSKREIGMRLG